MRQKISLEETPHFILEENERCPFLNADNLCELICALGEGGLCDICNEHPRFYNAFSDRVECGLGLCCEEASRLILSQKEKVAFLCDGIIDQDDFWTFRQAIFSILQDRSFSMGQRIRSMLQYCDAKELPPLSQWKTVYQKLERLDPQWDCYIEQFEDFSDWYDRWDLPCEQLAVYLAYRHLAGGMEDGRLKERIRFIALSLFIFNCLSRNATAIEDLYELARIYSSEIEYSDENIDALLEYLTE